MTSTPSTCTANSARKTCVQMRAISEKAAVYGRGLLTDHLLLPTRVLSCPGVRALQGADGGLFRQLPGLQGGPGRRV